jgi:glucuronate isomerase
MSVEDGLVMQIHVGAYRNHNPYVSRNFGPDRGFDLPLQVEWTRNLKPLLDAFGMNSKLRLILFTLDESSYSRELAPIAGAYPAVRLGPPWWFHDSPNGMMRYFERVMETAGIFNTVGFNDDTRGFLSIPARHDLWRRISAVWLAKLVHRGQLSLEAARDRMQDLSYDLAKKGYRLEEEPQSSERF